MILIWTKGRDKAIKLGLNWPMGLLTLLDYVGLDTTLAITEVMQKELDQKYQANPLLRQSLSSEPFSKSLIIEEV